MIARTNWEGHPVSMMSNPAVSLDDLSRVLADLTAVPSGADPLLLVHLDARLRSEPLLHTGLPVVIVGLSRDDLEDPAAECCDTVLHPDDTEGIAAICARVRANPSASLALCLVLRGAQDRSIDDGLLVESATYSALQASPEFMRWRASRPARAARNEEQAPVALERSGHRLDVILSRPHVRNALNTAMRDALIDAFELAALDPSIAEVHLSGSGPSFCAGGDLDEFGSFPDPAAAHIIRLQQSVGRVISAAAASVTAHLHGACYGSGIELPAFADQLIAAPDTSIALPELALGLIPGAGGTVSLPHRIGRHRTARLALTGERIDAYTALAWGLVDEVAPAP